MLRLLKTVRLRVIQPLASNKTQIHPYVTLGAASRTIRAKLAHTQDPRVALAHDSKITSAFSTQPQWLRNILCADHTRADVHHLSKTHLTWDIDGWPTPVKSRIYFNRDGKPWSTVNTRDARSPFGYFEDANKDTSALFDDAKPHRCVFAYKHSCANLDGNWDYLDDFDVAYCFLTRDTQILQDELDRIAEAAGEETEWLLIVRLHGRSKTCEWHSANISIAFSLPSDVDPKAFAARLEGSGLESGELLFGENVLNDWWRRLIARDNE